MHNAKALVSLAIGSRQQSWKRYCEPNWQAYGRKYRFDVLCLDRPLDNSERASKRSPAWQKCLILSQPFAQKYQRIVWLDSDILINNRIAADITEAVPVEKI